MKRVKSCIYKENKDCAFLSKKGSCNILSDVFFSDNQCHFYKTDLETENVYDQGRKKKYLTYEQALTRLKACH